MSERKGQYAGNLDGIRNSLAIVEDMLSMARSVTHGPYRDLYAVLERCRDEIEAQIRTIEEEGQGYQFNDTRPLDAKSEQVPGAHGAYR